MSLLCDFRGNPGIPVGTHGGLPREPVGRPTGTHGIPKVISILPAESHGTPWHTVGFRGNSLEISLGVPREFPWCVPTDAMGPHDTSYGITSSKHVGFLEYRYPRPWVSLGIIVEISAGIYWTRFPRFPVGYRGIPRDAVGSRGYSRYTTGKKKHPAGHRGFPRDVPLFTVGCTTDPHGAPWYTVGSH